MGANVRDGVGAKRIVNFRGTTIAGGTDVDQFGIKSVNPIVGQVDVKWCLQGFLLNATVKGKVMAKLI